MKTETMSAFATISTLDLCAVIGGVKQAVPAGGGAKQQVPDPQPKPDPSKPGLDGSICRASSIAYGATLGTIAGSALPVVGNAIAGIAGGAIGQVIGEQTCPP